MKHEGISEAFRMFRSIPTCAQFMAIVLPWVSPTISVILASSKRRIEILTILFTSALVHPIDAIKLDDILRSIKNGSPASAGGTMLFIANAND